MIYVDDYLAIMKMKMICYSRHSGEGEGFLCIFIKFFKIKYCVRDHLYERASLLAKCDTYHIFACCNCRL